MRAAVYARISLDRREGEGVARQLDLCRTLAAERGWEVTAEFVDNGVSAYQRRTRPQWVKLLRALKDGSLDAVLAYHPDRLYRRVTDLEDLIDAIETQGVQVATVQAGDIDLATASGRMVARMLGAAARHESERTAERVRASKKRNAGRGIPSGGGHRPYGYAADLRTIVEEEADELRTIAKRIVTGESTLTSEVGRLNREGLTTTAGNHWTHVSLRRVLTSARVAGLRSYRGQVVAEGDWPAIVDRPTWEMLCAQVASRTRGRPPSGRFLLSSLLACDECKGKLLAMPGSSGHRYKCHTSTIGANGAGCGKVSIMCRAVDLYVTSTVSEWLTDPSLPAVVGAAEAVGNPGKTRVKLEEVDRRLRRLAERWAEGEIGDETYESSEAILRRRRAELEQTLAGMAAPMAAVTREMLVDGWENGSTEMRRAVLRELAVVPILVRPSLREGHRLTTAERVDLRKSYA